MNCSLTLSRYTRTAFAHYPHQNEQGKKRKKNTRLESKEVVRRLIDPQVAPLLTPPRNTRELMVSAVNSWVLAYDNMSVIPQWMSDALCMLSTGGAMAGNTSFKRAERNIIHVQRLNKQAGAATELFLAPLALLRLG